MKDQICGACMFQNVFVHPISKDNFSGVRGDNLSGILICVFSAVSDVSNALYLPELEIRQMIVNTHNALRRKVATRWADRGLAVSDMRKMVGQGSTLKNVLNSTLSLKKRVYGGTLGLSLPHSFQNYLLQVICIMFSFCFEGFSWTVVDYIAIWSIITSIKSQIVTG